MNGSDSLIDHSAQPAVGGASFQIVKRGYDPVEVQAFARAVSSELQRLSLENQELRARIRDAEAAVQPRRSELDESSVAQYLGSETTRLLQAARDTAAGIVHRAEERAEQIVSTSNDDARRVRDEGIADAAHERRVAADEARKLIADASEQRRSVLAELARRRDTASAQLRDLLRGRDVLVQALANVSGSANDLLQRLDSISTTPADFVNLDPAIPDGEAGLDRGAVLKIGLAPPTPGDARDLRSVPGLAVPAAPAGLPAPDDGSVFTLES